MVNEKYRRSESIFSSKGSKIIIISNILRKILVWSALFIWLLVYESQIFRNLDGKILRRRGEGEVKKFRKDATREVMDYSLTYC